MKIQLRSEMELARLEIQQQAKPSSF